MSSSARGARRPPLASHYHRIQLALGALALLVDAAYLVTIVVLGAGPVLDRIVRSVTDTWWAEVAAMAIGVGAGQAMLSLPLGWVRGWLLPRRFGLLHQSLLAWIGDRAKAALLGGLFGLLVIEVIYALLRASDLWWLWAALIVTLLSLVAATVFPVWIVPLFYRMTPLADEALRRRLLGLAERAGIRAVDVMVVDQSRKSRTANAALTGFGRTRRIILFDTLVTSFTPDEIEAVLAHELGHHVHHDLWRGVGLQIVLGTATFAVADRILRAVAPAVGIAGIADPAGLPVLALVLGGLGLLAVPLANLVSRRQEYRADTFSIHATGGGAALVRALDRLGALNLAERRPPRLVEVLLYSHPALDRRIAALQVRDEAAVSPSARVE